MYNEINISSKRLQKKTFVGYLPHIEIWKRSVNLAPNQKKKRLTRENYLDEAVLFYIFSGKIKKK